MWQNATITNSGTICCIDKRRCTIPTFEYECKEHGIFEIFNQPKVESRPCVYCGGESEYHPAFPNIDPVAATQWNAPADPSLNGQVFSDKKKYYEAIDRAGLYINEPGMREDAKRNEQYYIEGIEKGIEKKLDMKLRDWGSDRIQKGIEVDRQIQAAQARGDENAIHQMGGLTSLDEAYRKAQDTQIVVEARKPA